MSRIIYDIYLHVITGVRVQVTFRCCSEAAGGSDPDEGDTGVGRQDLQRRVPYERLAAGSDDHVVEGKQTDQEDVPDRKCRVVRAEIRRDKRRDATLRLDESTASRMHRQREREREQLRAFYYSRSWRLCDFVGISG